MRTTLGRKRTLGSYLHRTLVVRESRASGHCSCIIIMGDRIIGSSETVLTLRWRLSRKHECIAKNQHSMKRSTKQRILETINQKRNKTLQDNAENLKIKKLISSMIKSIEVSYIDVN
jgi:hypothetical protein